MGEIHLDRYESLGKYMAGYAASELGLVVIIGRPGTAKSTVVRDAVGDRALWVCGRATPFHLYTELHENRDAELLVLDDSDDLVGSPQGARLLREICQTEREKTIHWGTASRQLEKLGIPRAFVLHARTCLILNQWWRGSDEAVRAVADRGHVLRFEPSPVEVHLRATGFFWDQAIHDYIGANLSFLPDVSLRTYIKAFEARRAGLDWKQTVMASASLPEPLAVVKRLLDDPTLSTESERVRRFVEDGHGSRSTFFERKRKLQSYRCMPPVPPIPLQHKYPPAVVSGPATPMLSLGAQFQS